MYRKLWLILGVAALVCATGCARRVYRPTVPLPGLGGQPEEQVVYLRGGGEVRGTLIERSPQVGVVLKLYDGSTRTVANDQVEYVGRGGTGALRIDAAEPGQVSLDRLPVGHTPLQVDNLEAGQHIVKVEFDGGDSEEVDALVYPGRVTGVTVPGSKLREIARLREGTRLVVGGGPLLGTGLGVDDALGGFGLQAGINYGVSPRLDFRAMGHVSLGGNDLGVWYEFAASAGIRLNLGSVYSMELGARLSLMPERAYHYDCSGRSCVDSESWTVMPAVGPQFSLLSLRLGADRSYELTLWHTVQLPLAAGDTYDDDASFRTSLSFSHVWL